MDRNIIETVMGGVVLIVAAGFIALAFQSGAATSPSGYQVTAEFDNASGLGPGSEVRMSGVKIGTVASQRLDPDTFFAVVTLDISDYVKLPRDPSARIIADGLLGSNVVALAPGGADETAPPRAETTLTRAPLTTCEPARPLCLPPSDGPGA